MPHWQNAVPGKPERNEKVDAAVPWLGSGDWPAHPAVRGTPNAVSVKKSRNGPNLKDENRSELIPSAFIVLPENPSLFQRPGVAEPTNLKYYKCLIDVPKMYRTRLSGNTKSKEMEHPEK